MPAAPRPTPTDLLALPKVDLYRRLGGALTSAASPFTNKQGLPSIDAWSPWMDQIEAQMASSNGLQAGLRAVIETARRDNIAHLELAVSPVALAAALGSLEAAFDALARVLEEVHLEQGPSLGCLISVASAPTMERLAQVASLARERKQAGILGLVARLTAEDPAEADDLLAETLGSDLALMVHLAPDIQPDAAFERLERLAPARIAFGNRTLQNIEALGWIRQSRPAMLVCLSAERAAGIWSGEEAHPIVQMIQAGMQVNLATWAPGFLATDLTGEYQMAAESLGLTLEALRGLTLAGVQASFLPKLPKRQLERQFEDIIFGFPTGV